MLNARNKLQQTTVRTENNRLLKLSKYKFWVLKQNHVKNHWPKSPQKTKKECKKMVLNDNKETFDRRASKWFNFILS